MATKKNLGTGLDLLLSANASSKLNKPEGTEINRAQSLFEQAIAQDEEGHVFETYYLYRRVIDSLESARNLAGAAKLYSQACNNIAIILHEAGDFGNAISYLQKALKIHPDNSIAQENLSAICELKEE